MRLTALLIFLFLSVPLFAQQPTQTRAELEARRKQILDAIKQTEDQLAATKKDKNATMGELRALQNKLAERQHLIGNINDEIGQISNTIANSSNEVVSLKQRLEQLKLQYAQSIRYAYATRSSYGMLAFLFSSDNFNDAVRRMKYLKKFRDQRKAQVEQIRVTQAQIQHKIGILNNEKAQKDELLLTQVQQKQVLQQETNQTNDVVKDLKGREQELTTEIQKNKKIEAKVNKAIDDVIKREIELAMKKAEEEAKKKAAADAVAAARNTSPGKPPSNIKVEYIPMPGTAHPKAPKTTKPESNVPLLLTPSDLALSNDFENNHGRLPWPVEKGFVSDHFGVHPHPVAEKVMIENNGVDIRTSAGATARAVFEGTVSSAFLIQGNGWTVIVQHGKFYTVYNGLSTTSVKKGDHVDTKQAIGVVGNNDEGEPTINFQIWKAGAAKQRNKLNPETWIAPR